jgi:predicted Na+-dependent transporter
LPLPPTSGAALPDWLTLFAAATVFTVMLSLGLLLGREPFVDSRRRRFVLAAIAFAVAVPVPALATLYVVSLDLRGAAAAGILLMAVSPGAPVALRRAIDVGGTAQFAPALHLAIVVLAVITLPLSVLVLDAIFAKDFTVTPLQVARQVFLAQLLPLGLGAAVRLLRPAAAARLQPRLARLSNLMLLALLVACAGVLWPLLLDNGWTPVVAGAVLTVGALGIGAAFAGRDAAARPTAAVATAMRNPGLALLIAAVNHLPASVTAAVFGYALGAAAVVTAFVVHRERRRPRAA